MIGGVQEEIKGTEINLGSTVLIQLSGEVLFKPTEIEKEVQSGGKNVKGPGLAGPDWTM